MKICIYGSANEKIDDKYKDAVKDLSVKLAKRGHSLVFGGGKHGVMGASARGFNEVGGGILGITPEFFKQFDVECLYEQCTDRIWVETMHERKYNMEEISDAFVICPGGIGTYDEFFSVLTNKQLDRTVKPIAVFNVSGFYDKLLDTIEFSIGEKFISPGCRDLFAVFSDADELIDYIESDRPFEYLKKKKVLKEG